MTIECMEFRKHIKGNLLGFLNIYVPKMGIEIFGCSLWQKDGRRWINLPSREYQDNEGNTKYMPSIRFREKSHYNGFIKAAKDALDIWCRDNPDQEPKQDPQKDPFSENTYEKKEMELPF